MDDIYNSFSFKEMYFQVKQDVQLKNKKNKEELYSLGIDWIELWKVEQGCIKLIKSHSKDIYNATKDFF